jgi:hypothetical protein
MARLARNSPAGTPNCGQDAIRPRDLLARAHSMESKTDPPHSPPTYFGIYENSFEIIELLLGL